MCLQNFYLKLPQIRQFIRSVICIEALDNVKNFSNEVVPENPTDFPKSVRIFFPAPYFPKMLAKSSKSQFKILTEGSLFGSLETLTFRTFSKNSPIYVSFTDSGSVTAWVCDTASH